MTCKTKAAPDTKTGAAMKTTSNQHLNHDLLQSQPLLKLVDAQARLKRALEELYSGRIQHGIGALSDASWLLSEATKALEKELQRAAE